MKCPLLLSNQEFIPRVGEKEGKKSSRSPPPPQERLCQMDDDFARQGLSDFSPPISLSVSQPLFKFGDDTNNPTAPSIPKIPGELQKMKERRTKNFTDGV